MPPQPRQQQVVERPPPRPEFPVEQLGYKREETASVSYPSLTREQTPSYPSLATRPPEYSQHQVSSPTMRQVPSF
jgi:hypothetical protein